MAGQYQANDLPAQQFEIVTELQIHDVLFGRGSGPNDHEGNIRFRQLVAERKAEYLATNHRLTKAKIAREIVDEVFAVQGRFLKKMEAEDLLRAGLPEGTEAWIGVDNETIMEKAKQALRQNANKKTGAVTSSPASQPMPQDPVQQQPSQKVPVQQIQTHHQTYQDNTQIPHYVYDDLEPIPLQVSSQVPSPRHTQRPSERTMPPPTVVSAAVDWQMQQRQQRLQQHQQYITDPPQYSNTEQQQQQQQQIYNQGMVDQYQDRDNMVHYVPRSMMQPPQNRLSSGQIMMNNNISVSDLPATDAPFRNSLRGSIATLGEVVESMDMSQLMSSFQSTKISDDRRMMASTETMGTIEPLPVGGESVADMSIGTMNSSTFSILKGDDSNYLLGGGGTPTGSSLYPRALSTSAQESLLRSSIQSTGGNTAKFLSSDSSLSFADLRSSGTNFVVPPPGGRRASLNATNLEGVKEEDNDPLPVGMGGALGDSSLSMLKGMVMSTDDVLQQQQEQLQQQGNTDRQGHSDYHRHQQRQQQQE